MEETVVGVKGVVDAVMIGRRARVTDKLARL